MTRGGKRKGSGRKKIGNIINLRIEKKLLETIEEKVEGKNRAEKVRLCLQTGLRQIEGDEKMNKIKVLDMFCGCGGLSLGFINAGYNVVLGVDNDEMALKTYQYNLESSKGLKADLFTDEAINDIKNVVDKKIGNTENIDVIIGGPPCQGFSLTGSRDINDSRNKLYLAMVKVIRLFNPKLFLIENVQGIATLYNGIVKKQIINTFTDMGYKMSVTPKPLLAADFGVPQMRRRMFFVGVRSDIYKKKGRKFEFPTPIKSSSNYVTCSDAISDLPSREDEIGNEVDSYTMEPQTDYQRSMRGNCNKLFNHVATAHTEMVKSTIALVPDGGNYKDLPKGYGESRRFHEAWTRYASNKPSRTIDTGHRNHFHYKYNRVPTIRENARLQSFPDNFRFLGNKTQQNKQVGNAVPPLLAYNIAMQLKKYLETGDDK